MRVPVRDMAGETVGEIELNDQVFGIEPNVPVMHQALVRQMANARLGTHDTKTRGEVAGGGRKPWRQKGTGRARQGSTRAPHWRGGGTVFGPTPRSYEQKMNRKMRRLALRSALSVKTSDQQLLVIDELSMDSVKTRDMVSLLDRLGLDSSVLMLLPERNEAVELSARNLPYVKVQRATNLSVRDLLGYDYVMLTRGAVEQIESILG
ncbi:MAG: 50S ribosomal protein L4 [Anaerolineales bacterium]